jgi:peptide/nickel transport system substrate-binding protein
VHRQHDDGLHEEQAHPGCLRPARDPGLIDIEPDLAESWEVTDDATKFTFKLRQGAKFHNIAPVSGREFDSEDVTRLGRALRGRWHAAGRLVASRDRSRRRTPTPWSITLDQPLVDFPRNIAAWSHMDAREMVADPMTLREQAIGTGPFIHEEWIRNERSSFVANRDYWEEGLPFLDRIDAVVQNDLAAQRAAFQTHNLVEWHVGEELEAQQVLRETRDVVYLKIYSAQGTNTSGMHFQMRNPKFHDERVRRAFSLAIDRVEWDLSVFKGDGGGFSRVPIAWQILHDEPPTEESQGEWYQFDPQKARQLLQAAGYSADSPLRVDAPAWYKRRDYAQIMTPMYGDIPEMDFRFREVDNPTAVSMLNDRNFEDTMNVTWGPPAYSVDQAVYPWYLSTGGLNFNNVNDAEMDRLLIAQRGEATRRLRGSSGSRSRTATSTRCGTCSSPRPCPAETFHNYLVNYRPHGIGTYLLRERAGAFGLAGRGRSEYVAPRDVRAAGGPLRHPQRGASPVPLWVRVRPSSRGHVVALRLGSSRPGPFLPTGTAQIQPALVTTVTSQL